MTAENGEADATDLEVVITSLEGDDANETFNDNEVVYQITTYGADFDVAGLVKRFERGGIYRPEFQRNFVWTLAQASKFIESILLGLPIPSVFLYREEKTQKFLIVDGLQRLTTLHAFKKGRLPNSDKVFKLKDVRPQYQGRSLEELNEEDQRRFEDAIIHAMIIQQASPDDDNSSVYHIFERLNTNGTPLQPQEMRAAIYHGEFQSMLERLNLNPAWREIFGSVHKRAKDQELILRFLALRYNREVYQKPMKGFLNNFMNRYRNLNSDDAIIFKHSFDESISRIHEALGKSAFRISRSMNVSYFDAFMVAVSENKSATAAQIKEASDHLVQNRDFLGFIAQGTSSETSVQGRISIAKEVLDAAVSSHS